MFYSNSHCLLYYENMSASLFVLIEYVVNFHLRNFSFIFVACSLYRLMLVITVMALLCKHYNDNVDPVVLKFGR